MPYIYRTVKAGMVKKPPTGQGGRLCWKKIQVDPEFSHKRVCVKVENKKEHKEMYNPFIQVEIKDGELEQIMEELSQATETIYKCYSKLKVMAEAAGKAGDRPGSGTDAADDIRGGSTRESHPAAHAGPCNLCSPAGAVPCRGFRGARENDKGNLSRCGGLTMDKKAEFLKIWTDRVNREYADNLLGWLEYETDFFTAPASTRHHGAYPGGLLEHSLNVYHRLRAIVCVETYGTTTSDLLAEDVEETVAVLALLHDVCKVNCYHVETKRRKNPETGRWEDFQGYAFRDPLPLGHGEKSLYLIQRHMDLEPEEALAIRWHMGAYDNAAKADPRALSAAMAATPWVWRLQEADMCAAWVDEREAAEE